MDFVPNIYNNNKLEKILFPTKDGFEMLRICDINYCEADGNYTTIFLVDKNSFVVINKLHEVMEKLPAETFFRIHNSFGVNGNQIHKFYKSTLTVEMENQVILTVSERKLKDFYEFISPKNIKIDP